MNHSKKQQPWALLFVAAMSFVLPNDAGRFSPPTVVSNSLRIVPRRPSLGHPLPNRVLAIVHTAVYEAVNAITKRYARQLVSTGARTRSFGRLPRLPAASHATLAKLVPSQLAVIDSAYSRGAGIDNRRQREDHWDRSGRKGGGGNSGFAVR